MTAHTEPKKSTAEDVLRSMNEIIALTEGMIAAMEQEQYDALQQLTGERQLRVEEMAQHHQTVTAGDRPIAPLREAGAQLEALTATLQQMMRERSASLMAAINAMKHNRYYGNTR